MSSDLRVQAGFISASGVKQITNQGFTQFLDEGITLYGFNLADIQPDLEYVFIDSGTLKGVRLKKQYNDVATRSSIIISSINLATYFNLTRNGTGDGGGGGLTTETEPVWLTDKPSYQPKITTTITNTNSVIVTGDTVEVSLGKTQGQINALIPATFGTGVTSPGNVAFDQSKGSLQYQIGQLAIKSTWTNKSSANGAIPVSGTKSTPVVLISSNFPALLEDGDYYKITPTDIGTNKSYYTLPNGQTYNVSINDKVVFNKGDNEYDLVSAGDNQVAGDVPFTPIAGDSSHSAIPSPDLQLALNDISILLKSLQSSITGTIAASLADDFIFPTGTIVNGDHFTFSSASLSSDSLVPIKIPTGKTAILTQALSLQVIATSGTLPAFTIKVCKLNTDGTLDTSSNGTMYQYSISSSTGVIAGQLFTAGALNSTVGNLTFSGSSLSYLGINISGLSAPLSTEAFIIQSPFFQIQ